MPKTKRMADNQTVVLSPSPPDASSVNARFQELGRAVVERHLEAFKRLADK